MGMNYRFGNERRGWQRKKTASFGDGSFTIKTFLFYQTGGWPPIGES
jgi:hypothetical protein